MFAHKCQEACIHLQVLFTSIKYQVSGKKSQLQGSQMGPQGHLLTRTESFQYQRDLNAFKDLIELYGSL